MSYVLQFCSFGKMWWFPHSPLFSVFLYISKLSDLHTSYGPLPLPKYFKIRSGNFCSGVYVLQCRQSCPEDERITTRGTVGCSLLLVVTDLLMLTSLIVGDDNRVWTVRRLSLPSLSGRREE